MTETILNLAQMVHCCGYWAAKRWFMKKTGYNEATAIRCIQAAKLCEVMEKIA